MACIFKDLNTSVICYVASVVVPRGVVVSMPD